MNALRGKGRCGVLRSLKTVWSMPERFRGELLTMGRCTNPASFTFTFFTYILHHYITASVININANCYCSRALGQRWWNKFIVSTLSSREIPDITYITCRLLPTERDPSVIGRLRRFSSCTYPTCWAQDHVKGVYIDAPNPPWMAPRYSADSVQSIAESSHRPGLRSADTADYIKRRTRFKFGERSFSHAGPAAWNSLPDNIKLTNDTNRFKRLLKSHLFHLASCHSVSAPGQFCKCPALYQFEFVFVFVLLSNCRVLG